MSTVERPLTPEMREELVKLKRGLRIMGRFGDFLSVPVLLIFKIGGAIFAVLSLALVVLTLRSGFDLTQLLIAAVLGWMAFGGLRAGSRGGQRALSSGLDRLAAQIDRDLQAGMYFETLGDMVVEPQADGITTLILPDRTLNVPDASGKLARLARGSPIRGVTIHYVPTAQYVFEIKDPENRVLFKPESSGFP